MPKTASRPRKPASKPPAAIGDFVLLGGTRASYPADWYLGEVLWIGNGDVLVRRDTQNGQSWRQLYSSSEIRAAGTIDDLVAIRRQASESVQDFQSKIYACESALAAARDALFRKLDELAAGGLKIIPPDFAAIDADHQRDQAASEQYDIENEGVTA
jgi:hypothetical protein